MNLLLACGPSSIWDIVFSVLMLPITIFMGGL